MSHANANQHIEEFLIYYLDTDFHPDFAILLHGEWGCGKTWFIKNFRDQYLEKNDEKPKRRLLYISLYGVRSTNEIEEQIFQQLHPVLSSKSMALTGKVLKGILKTSLKIDLDNDGLPDYLKKTDDCVLIFDDLERSSLPIEEILGYINSFVEHQGLKVILLANEEELLKGQENPTETENEQSPKEYKRIKEKLIGKSFRVNHDIATALSSFVEQARTEEIRKCLQDREKRITEIFKLADYNNLRHLKQSCWDFGRLFLNIDESFRAIPDLIDDLLSIFLAFSFEIKAGKISSKDIRNLEFASLRKVRVRNEDQEKNPQPIDEVLTKYSFINPNNVVLSEECWRDFFDRGFISKERLAETLRNSTYFRNENTLDWVKLYHYWHLEDSEFPVLLEKVRDQWKSRSFTEPGEILHVSGLFLRFSNIGLLSKETDEIMAECKKYIDDIKGAATWSNCELDRDDYLETVQWED